MSYSEPKELIRAKKFIEEGNIEKALRIVNDFGKKKDLSSHERISYYTFKSKLARRYFSDINEIAKYAEKAYRESQKLENSLLLLDVYIQMANTLALSKVNESVKFIKKCEELLKTLPQELSTELKKREADILYIKGWTYPLKGELEKSIEYAEQALALRQELEINTDIIFSLLQLGELSWKSGDLNHASEYLESCKILAKNLNLKQIIHQCDAQFGAIYGLKGELDLALCYFEKVLAFAEKANDLYLMSNMYNNIGINYQEKGDFSRALENLEKSITLKEKRGRNLEILFVSDTLFHLSLDMNDLEMAQRYLNRMKQIADREENEKHLFNQLYRIDRAVYLKNSPRAFNRGKAEEMLKQLIEEGITFLEALKKALLNLCDLLLIELYETNEPEILGELQVYISQLFDNVKNTRSYSLLAETYLLQARLSLITLNMIKARQFLTKAQEIAENYGLNRLAIKISNEHDELLKKLDVWDKLKVSKAPLSKRMELARPNEQMERMIRKREIIVPKLTDEDPIILLIISEGGTPIFSESFVKEWSFEDHLFGGFLTAINSFSDEIFSEGLNRANFGEYTIIMNSLYPFLVCYLFKGQSYSAQQRIRFFIEELKEDKDAWQTFREFYRLNKEIQMKDIPSLEPLITKIFIDKSIPIIT
ncbi:MAG: tetratricopeptide repeat protein [Promethearchaeota archaeon]